MTVQPPPTGPPLSQFLAEQRALNAAAQPDTYGAYGDREPVRLPLWAAIAGSQATGFAIAMLTGAAWRPALAAVLTAVGPLMFGVEVARQRAWSPLSVLNATEQARQDERSSDSTAG